jgi:5-methylcytosine-specific restriction endonuclease McrA
MIKIIDCIKEKNFKTCKRCHSVKSVGEFYTDKRLDGGLQLQCKECEKQYRKNYYKEKKEEIRVKHKQYYIKNKEKILNNQKKYRQENPDIIRNEQKEYGKTESGKAKRLSSRQRHRAQKMGATVEDFTSQEVFIRDRYICQACGIKTRPDYKNPNHSKYPNLDHIIPLSKGGEHSKRNTQCLCHQCNISKGSRHANDQMLLIG